MGVLETAAAGYVGADPRERAVVFLEDIEGLDYVRVGLERAYSPAGPLYRCGGGRTVGYATLPADAGGRCFGAFERRIFYLLDIDRDGAPGGIYADGVPAGAVDPRTVGPGRAGELTARALGRGEDPPLKEADEGGELSAAEVYELEPYRRSRTGAPPKWRSGRGPCGRRTVDER